MSENTADRLLQAELSPFNMNPPKGLDKYKKASQLYLPEKTTWYMPESVNGQHIHVIEPDSQLERN